MSLDTQITDLKAKLAELEKLREQGKAKIPIKLKRPKITSFDLRINDNIIKHIVSEGSVSEGSAKQYLASVKSLHETLFKNTIFDLSAYMTESSCQKVIEHILTLNEEYRRPTYVKLFAVFRAMNPDIIDHEIYKKYHEAYRHLPTYHKFKRPTALPKVTFDDVEKLRRQYKKAIKEPQKKPFTTYTKYVALCLYTMMPPLRPADYLNTKLVTLPDDSKITSEAESQGNLIDLKSGKMAIAFYKSRKGKNFDNGVRILQFPEPLMVILKDYHKQFQPTFLFESEIHKKGQPVQRAPMKRQSFTGMWKAFELPERISPVVLRRLYISTKIIDGQLVAEERERLAKIMGHTITTQNNIYSQYSHILWGKQSQGSDASDDDD